MHYLRLWRYGDPLKRHRTPNGEAVSYLFETVLNYDGDECLIWPYARDFAGYGKVAIDGKIKTVSRVVCADANGEPPSPRHEAAHLCGKGHMGCVAKAHLAWKLPKENHADKIAHGTHLRGEKQNGAKLTEAHVREIRKLYKHTSQYKLGEIFGVSRGCIKDIVLGNTWSWLK
jgi:hypothetical protein